MRSRSTRRSAMVRIASGRNWLQGWMWTWASTTMSFSVAGGPAGGRATRRVARPRCGRGSGRAGCEDDLAEHRAVGHGAVPLRDLLQRQDAIDDRPQPARGDEAGDAQELGAAAHRRAEDRQALEEDVSQVGRRDMTGGRTAGDQPSATDERLHAPLPGLGAGAVDDDVDAAPAGRLPHGVE